MVLGKTKEMTKVHLGTKVTQAVVTVPSTSTTANATPSDEEACRHRRSEHTKHHRQARRQAIPLQIGQEEGRARKQGLEPHHRLQSRWKDL